MVLLFSKVDNIYIIGVGIYNNKSNLLVVKCLVIGMYQQNYFIISANDSKQNPFFFFFSCTTISCILKCYWNLEGFAIDVKNIQKYNKPSSHGIENREVNMISSKDNTKMQLFFLFLLLEVQSFPFMLHCFSPRRLKSKIVA